VPPTTIDAAPHGTIEVVRAPGAPQIPLELVRFWHQTGALDAATADRRARESVCLLKDDFGAVTGAAAVFDAAVPLVGGRRFWIYRGRLAEHATGAGTAMLKATFDALAAEFDPASGGPIGLCLLMDDEQRRRRPREAQWADPPMLYAGYGADGRQVRIGYFPDARISRV
jgi:hypothetical protein